MKKQEKNNQIPSETKTLKRQFQGIVESAKENKTIHVTVKNITVNAKYRKQFSQTKKYAVHDEKGMAKVGDEVLFEECRPLSKTKRWRLLEVVRSENV